MSAIFEMAISIEKTFLFKTKVLKILYIEILDLFSMQIAISNIADEFMLRF